MQGRIYNVYTPRRQSCAHSIARLAARRFGAAPGGGDRKPSRIGPIGKVRRHQSATPFRKSGRSRAGATRANRASPGLAQRLLRQSRLRPGSESPRRAQQGGFGVTSVFHAKIPRLVTDACRGLLIAQAWAFGRFAVVLKECGITAVI